MLVKTFRNCRRSGALAAILVICRLKGKNGFDGTTRTFDFLSVDTGLLLIVMSGSAFMYMTGLGGKQCDRRFFGAVPFLFSLA